MRYRAAAGVGEEARGSTLPAAARVPVVETGVNVETWRHVTDPIVMAHAFAELRYGIVAILRQYQHESGFKCGHISAQTL